MIFTYAKVETHLGTFIKKSDKNGNVWHIPTDPDNSDYQAYLATLVTESAPTA